MKFYKFFVCCLLILSASSFLLADVLYVKMNDLAKFAFDIIEGKVIKVEQKWDKEHKFIYTYTTIRVEKSIKNKITAKEITLKEIGGQLDGFTTSAPCQPEYEEGESVLVFLQKDGEYYRTYGLNQGKFKIDTIKGEKILSRNINPDELTILDKSIKRMEGFEWKQSTTIAVERE